LANGKNPAVGMENDFKRYQFAAHILTNSVQQENHKLRQELGSIQERLEMNERLYNGVLDQLRSKEKHNLTLEKAATTAYELVDLVKITSRSETGQQDRNEIGIAEHEVSNRNSSPFMDPTAQKGTNVLHDRQSSGMHRLYTIF
jgi:hypothetical protein